MRTSAVAFRHLGARAVLLGTDNGNSLQNVNTTDLDDGCLCYVTEFAAYYMLDKASTSTPVGDVIVQPAAGPGRWLFLVGPDVSELWMSMKITAFQASSNLTQSTWANTPSGAPGLYTMDTPGPGLWTIDGQTGLVTYNGQNGKWFQVTVSASIATESSEISDFEVSADNGAFVGTTNDDFYAQRQSSTAVIDDPFSFTASKMINLSPGTIIRPIFRNMTGTDNFDVQRLSMFAVPVL